jgi:hypothetical protein
MVVTMLGKIPCLRALLWHLKSYYNFPDISIFRYPTGIVITREYCSSYDLQQRFVAADPLVMAPQIQLHYAEPEERGPGKQHIIMYHHIKSYNNII